MGVDCCDIGCSGCYVGVECFDCFVDIIECLFLSCIVWWSDDVVGIDVCFVVEVCGNVLVGG